LLYRRASLPGYSTEKPGFRELYTDKMSLKIIDKISLANDTFNPPLFQLEKTIDSLDMDTSSVKMEIQSPIKFQFNSPEKKASQNMIPTIVKPFEASAREMNENSDSDPENNEIPVQTVNLSPPSSRDLLKSPRLQQKETIETAKIDLKIHKYQEDFDILLEIEKEENTDKMWRHVVNKPGTNVYQRKAGESPICMIKAFCEVDYSADTVFKAIWDTEIRKKWDTIFNDFRLIDSNPDYDVLYYMIKTPFGITKRDWVQRRIFIRNYPEPNTIMMHFISIDHPLMPPRKGVVRAETILSGYLIRPVTQRTCTVTIITQNDVKGLIPKSIVNSLASKAPAEWVNNMNKGCKLVAGY